MAKKKSKTIVEKQTTLKNSDDDSKIEKNPEGEDSQSCSSSENENGDQLSTVSEENTSGDQAKGEVSYDEVIKLETEVADLSDKLLRALAETENVRRRAQRDKEDASRYGIKNFAEKMITVADNLSRGLKSIDTNERENDHALSNIALGFELVERELLNGLSQFGIKQIDALGKKFDPMIHEAMFEVEDSKLAAGTIMQVLEVGYLLHERTLRAAKVGIARGGPKVMPPEAESPESEATVNNQNSCTDQQAYENKGAEPGGQLDEKL